MKHLLRATLLSASLLLSPWVSANTETDAVRDNLFTIPLSAYQLDAKDPSQRIYLKPGVTLSQYQQVIVEAPLFLHQGQDQQWELLQPNEESKIANYFKAKLSIELQKQGIKVVEQADANTLRLRFAVTGLAQTRPGLDLIDVLPAKAAINIAKMAIGKEPYLLRIGTMAQLEDASNGELLAGAVNLKETRKTKVKDKAITLDYLEKEIDKITKKSAAQLAHAMGKQ
ncbi:DUF3313 domain-containing protein [Chitinibacter fontanus]|uniref:DUF3313 domain-containing protein n=1 Tax=Chitinibacter fontanus TaxID=1737446 RepID=A0A7D5ZFA0_9NEIS|nr:DUF3313 domain-containing protein [Chitinibacter fontanus]QLI81408.1 DUF3313 domain-containing protein [Chitinibacter fontanus]